jgi:hypothetical protein
MALLSPSGVVLPIYIADVVESESEQMLKRKEQGTMNSYRAVIQRFLAATSVG